MKKMMTLVAFILTSANFSYAANWSHIQLLSQSGQKISVDYQVQESVYSLGRVASADSVWINISGPSLKPDSQVRVVFMNIAAGKSASDPGTEFYNVDLRSAGQNRFTGDIPYGLKESILNHRQELAVVIDGVWLKDSLSGLSNFQLDLYNSK